MGDEMDASVYSINIQIML